MNKMTRRTFLKGIATATGLTVMGYSLPDFFIGNVEAVSLPNTDVHEFDLLVQQAQIRDIAWAYIWDEYKVILTFRCYRPTEDGGYRKEKAASAVYISPEFAKEFPEFSPEGREKSPWKPPEIIQDMVKDEAVYFLETEGVVFLGNDLA